MKRICLTLVCFLFCILSFGQNVSGEIIDSAKEKIVGAYVVLSPTDTHAHSDDFGKFKIEGVRQGDTLKIMHIGFESKMVVVEGAEKE